MQVTFTLSPEDVLVQEERHIKKTQGLSLNQRLAIVLPIVAALVFGSYFIPGTPGQRRARVVDLMWTVGLPALCITAWVLTARRRALAKLQNLDEEIPGIYEPRTLRLEPEHLVAVDATGEAKTRWSAVKEVGETPERIFIQLAGDVGYVIPKPAFDSMDQASSFAATAEAYRLGGEET